MSIKHLQPNIYLTPTSGTTTLECVAANYFITMTSGVYATVNLPDVNLMSGQSLTFVVTSSSYESGFSIEGPIWLSDTSFSLNSPSSVTFLSNGSRWWITSYFAGP